VIFSSAHPQPFAYYQQLSSCHPVFFDTWQPLLAQRSGHLHHLIHFLKEEKSY
jgi:hypothetical protein